MQFQSPQTQPPEGHSKENQNPENQPSRADAAMARQKPTDRMPPTEVVPTEDSRPRALNAESLQSVRAARWVQWFGRVFAWGLILVPILLVLAPWRQNITGQGRVSALSPLDREQPIKAPISGRLQEWYVQEGSKVKEGDPLFRIEDQDSERLVRLRSQLDQYDNKFDAKEDKIQNLESLVEEVRLTRDELLNAIEAEIENAIQKVEAAKKKLEATEASRNFERDRYQVLLGLQDKELAAKLEVRRALAAVEVAEATYEIAVADLAGAEALVVEKRAKYAATSAKENAAIEKALGDVREAEGELSDIERDREEQNTKIARQESQLQTAPRDGTVFRLLGGQGGEIVKEGDRVLTFVPDQADTAVELWVDGNDAPLIRLNDSVRLQFEGWPAVQWVGWPSAAVGTYGGVVTLVDPATSPDHPGQFRVLVQPDPEDQPWPDSIYLRQGVRTKGWVLLREVKLGWELWRQLNGFPPTVSAEQPMSVNGERIK